MGFLNKTLKRLHSLFARCFPILLAFAPYLALMYFSSKDKVQTMRMPYLCDLVWRTFPLCSGGEVCFQSASIDTVLLLQRCHKSPSALPASPPAAFHGGKGKGSLKPKLAVAHCPSSVIICSKPELTALSWLAGSCSSILAKLWCN